MSDEVIRALLGARLRYTFPEPPELKLFDLLMGERGLENLRYTDKLREALRDIFTFKIIDEKDTMRAGYATKSRHIPLSFEEALKELLKRVF